MRLRTEQVRIKTGTAVLCDPGLLEESAEDLSDLASFDLLAQGDGRYSVYSDGERYFIDIDPRITRVGQRTWSCVPGVVAIDTARIGVVDATPNRISILSQSLEAGTAVAITVPPGEYTLWFEEKESKYHVFRGVIGFGKEPMLVLNGEFALTLQSCERRVAEALQTKGQAKHANLAAVREDLLAVYWAGCNDPRLAMLASAIRLALPRRNSKNRRLYEATSNRKDSRVDE